MSEHPTFTIDPSGLYGGGVVSSGTSVTPMPGGWTKVTPATMSYAIGNKETSYLLYTAMYKEIELSVRKGEPVEEQGRIYAGYFMRIHATILAEQSLATIKEETAELTSKAESELEAMKYEEVATVKADAMTASMEELKTRVALETLKRQLADAEKLSSKPSGFKPSWFSKKEPDATKLKT